VSFDQNASVFAGMSQEQLRAALGKAQNALIELQTGKQVVTVSYAEGEGNRSVHFSNTNPGALVQLINELKACLGLARTARRGLRVSF
jgi:gpW